MIVDFTMAIFLFNLYDSTYIMTIICTFYAFMCICVRFMQMYVFCRLRLSETLMWNREDIDNKLNLKLNSSSQNTVTGIGPQLFKQTLLRIKSYIIRLNSKIDYYILQEFYKSIISAFLLFIDRPNKQFTLFPVIFLIIRIVIRMLLSNLVCLAYMTCLSYLIIEYLVRILDKNIHVDL